MPEMPSPPPHVSVLTAGGAGQRRSTGSRDLATTLSSPPTVRTLTKSIPAVANDVTSAHAHSRPPPTQVQNPTTRDPPPPESLILEMEETEDDAVASTDVHDNPYAKAQSVSPFRDIPLSASTAARADESSFHAGHLLEHSKSHELFWLTVCFLGIMASFVCYGLLLEYTTSGDRELHELSFLFVTSGLYTLTAAAGRYVRDETPSTIPPARFAILGLTSMGSTFCSVRSLRYVIYPIQVLAKSCKPVPVMIMGAFMGKHYPLRKYINVVMIVAGVALFMGGGDGDNKKKSANQSEDEGSTAQLIGILLLFVSLCFDGGTGAYEDKLMSVHSVQPFDLMYNIQLGKTILAGVALLVLNQLHIFLQMVQDMGFLLVALGLSGALGQVFIFVTIAKFGALTCSIIGLARKVTTLVASIYFYGHVLNGVQFLGLCISVTAMVLNFWGKKGGGGHHAGGPSGAGAPLHADTETEKLVREDSGDAHVELTVAPQTSKELV